MADPVTEAMLTTTGSGYLLVLAIMLPALGVLLALAMGGRWAERVAHATLAAGVVLAVAIAVSVWSTGTVQVYIMGGWRPPLGVALRVDGLSAVMALASSVLLLATALFARDEFQTPEEQTEARAPFTFWLLLVALSAALNAVFLGGDLFSLYVALELLTFAAVPLVSLDGRAETLQAALRYLLFALLGSVLYLLGTALLYGAYGTLDIALLAQRIRLDPATWIAAALMTVGLLAKTAIVPLHLWLPPAHAGAPAAASAVLSALVVKGSFFIILRIWFYVMPVLPSQAAAQLLAAMGAAAILLGSVLALRQARLKLLIAYSTVAQLGYLFFMFPLVASSGIAWASGAWTGGILQALSHAFAKAAMFMAAGLIGKTLGHDRIDGLRGLGRVLPMTVFAFGIAGLSLMGVPPSGGFVAKWLLLSAAVADGQWWWSLVMLSGGLFACGYVIRVLAPAMSGAGEAPVVKTIVPRYREAVVLGLALISVVLGLLPLAPAELLQIGRPDAALQGFR